MRSICFPPYISEDETHIFRVLFSETVDNLSEVCTLYYTPNAFIGSNLQDGCQDFHESFHAFQWFGFDSKVDLLPSRTILNLPSILVFETSSIQNLQFPIKGLTIPLA